MQVLIIEDESLAADRLEKMLLKCEPNSVVLNKLDSVEAAIDWFKNNEQPELLFLDIQLADGISFDIFKEVDVLCPVIFTTAYDQYAIKAFDLNSVDYLLKPIEEEKLERAFDKFKRIKENYSSEPVDKLVNQIIKQNKDYKKRFLISIGSRLKSIGVENVAVFYSFDKNTFIKTSDNRDYPIDNSLDKLDFILDPDQFFRINRRVIINREFIQNISVYSKSRLKVKLPVELSEDLMVSSTKSHLFRRWLDS